MVVYPEQITETSEIGEGAAWHVSKMMESITPHLVSPRHGVGSLPLVSEVGRKEKFLGKKKYCFSISRKVNSEIKSNL